jgi:hypothetical protein
MKNIIKINKKVIYHIFHHILLNAFQLISFLYNQGINKLLVRINIQIKIIFEAKSRFKLLILDIL